MTVLTQNIYVYDCRLLLYHSKVNIISYERFMKPETGILTIVLYSNLTIFYQASPHFGGKSSSFGGDFAPKYIVVTDMWCIILLSLLAHYKCS